MSLAQYEGSSVPTNVSEETLKDFLCPECHPMGAVKEIADRVLRSDQGSCECLQSPSEWIKHPACFPLGLSDSDDLEVLNPGEPLTRRGRLRPR